MRNRLALMGLAMVTSITLSACGSDRTEEGAEYGTIDTAKATAPAAGTPATGSPARDASRDRDAERRAEAARASERAEADRARARENALKLPAGTVITLRNDATISSRHQNAGAQVSATSVTDVLDSRNRVVIPAGTRFLGRITRIESATGSNDTARLDLEFNALEVSGDAVPVLAEVQSFDAVARGRGVTAGQAGKVGAGAVIGGVAGRVIGGNTTGAVVGAVVGTAAGAVVANATRETDIVVDRGGTITLRLTGEFEQTRPIATNN